MCGDPPSEEIEIRVPGGGSSLGALMVSGDCTVDGHPLTCQPEQPTCDADSCACVASVRLLENSTSTDCRIAVTSATGAMFEADVPLKFRPAGSGPCAVESVGPVDVNQWIITVEFPDGGAGDGGADAGD
jgi:hypothetical protein